MKFEEIARLMRQGKKGWSPEFPKIYYYISDNDLYYSSINGDLKDIRVLDVFGRFWIYGNWEVYEEAVSLESKCGMATLEIDSKGNIINKKGNGMSTVVFNGRCKDCQKTIREALRVSSERSRVIHAREADGEDLG